MNVVIVSPYPLLPPLHGGRVRTVGLATGLARAGARVTVLCPWYPTQRRHGRLAGAFDYHSHFFTFNALPAVVPGWVAPPQALLSFQPRSQIGPRRWLGRYAHGDVFQFEFCAQARWLELVPARAKVVYSAHNVERDFHAADCHRCILRGPALRRIEHLERLAVRESDLVVTCSRGDVARIEELYGRPRATGVVPNGVDASLLEFRREALRDGARAALGFAPEERVVLFIGGDGAHNREALAFLVADVFPRLDSQARLLVVGRCGAALGGTNRAVRRVGFVDDPRPCFAAADVAVNAVGYGSGSNVKLVEYLAAGLPVVSTPVGLRGFTGPLSAVRVAPRETFAEALSGPLPEPMRDREALRPLTWDALGGRLFSLYEELLRERGEPPGVEGRGLRPVRRRADPGSPRQHGGAKG